MGADDVAFLTLGCAFTCDAVDHVFHAVLQFLDGAKRRQIYGIDGNDDDEVVDLGYNSKLY